MIRAVIFDLDGVVVDTEPLWFETYKKVFGEYGITFTQEHDKLAKGRSDAFSRLSEKFDLADESAEISAKIKATYKDLFYRKAKLTPGFTELINGLKGRYKLALATSAYKERVEFNLRKFPQLNSFFEVITNGDEIKNSKPSPDIFLLTAKRLGVDPRECLVIEDAESGVTAAKAAGMKVIGVNPGHVTPQDLSSADRIVTTLSKVDIKLF
ncbi:MAG: HAD family phosphatase [Candidatus Woykebacteria bacterium]